MTPGSKIDKNTVIKKLVMGQPHSSKKSETQILMAVFDSWIFFLGIISQKGASFFSGRWEVHFQ